MLSHNLKGACVPILAHLFRCANWHVPISFNDGVLRLKQIQTCLGRLCLRKYPGSGCRSDRERFQIPLAVQEKKFSLPKEQPGAFTPVSVGTVLLLMMVGNNHHYLVFTCTTGGRGVYITDTRPLAVADGAASAT